MPAARAEQPPPGVVVVCTRGTGSMDRYGQQLAAHLPVRRLDTSVGARSAEVFGVSLGGRAARRALAADVAFMRRLRATPGVPHLTNHHLARYGPLLGRGRRWVLTVHDLIRQRDLRDGAGLIAHPNRRDRLVLRADEAAIPRATALIAPSEATRRDVMARLGVPGERIAVVPEGIDHARFRPVAARPFAAPYVLFVGSEHPRKNLLGLLAAFAELKRDPRFATLRLVKVGAPGTSEAAFAAPVRRAVHELGLAGDVVFAGHVADDDLPGWYSGAVALAMPSLLEGFGLPPLEAMACGCPAVVSTGGSLPEVAGPGALVAGPHDVRGLRDALATLAGDPARRADLAARGRAWAARFTWRAAAEGTLRVYAEVAS